MITPAERVAEALRALMLDVLPDAPDMRPSDLNALDERREEIAQRALDAATRAVAFAVTGR